MTYEQALTWLEWFPIQGYATATEAKAIIRQAVELQIPQKAIKRDQDEKGLYPIYECPKCKNTIGIADTTFNHCANCGQKIR